MTSTGGTPDLVLRGVDGNECEEFIAAIEELAFTEGWSRDQERMLLFARSRLRHKALRWFARLDPSKKKDWDLFVEALFDQYPLVESAADSEAEIATPVWSATTFSPGASTVILPRPSDQGLDSQPTADDERRIITNNTRHFVLPSVRAYDPSSTGRQLGILRVAVEEGTTVPQYIWRGRPAITYISNGTTPIHQYAGLDTTIDRQEALVVCFIPSPEPHPIGCLNSTYYFGDISISYTPFGVHPYEMRVASGVGGISEDGYKAVLGTGHVSNVWNVLSDGLLQASLSALDPNSLDRGSGRYTAREDFKTTEVHLDTSGTSVCFVKPGTPLRQDDPKRNTQPNRYETKARIVFEPL